MDFHIVLSNKVSLVFPSFVYFLATKPMAKWSKASGQSSRGLWVENRAEIFEPLFLCLFVNSFLSIL